MGCKNRLEASVTGSFHCILPVTLTSSQICMAPSHEYIATWCEQVIAYTVLDINRTTRLNERPMTPEQHKQLEQMAREYQGKPGVCDPIRKLLAKGRWLACLLSYNNAVSDVVSCCLLCSRPLAAAGERSPEVVKRPLQLQP